MHYQTQIADKLGTRAIYDGICFCVNPMKEPESGCYLASLLLDGEPEYWWVSWENLDHSMDELRRYYKENWNREIIEIRLYKHVATDHRSFN